MSANDADLLARFGVASSDPVFYGLGLRRPHVSPYLLHRRTERDGPSAWAVPAHSCQSASEEDAFAVLRQLLVSFLREHTENIGCDGYLCLLCDVAIASMHDMADHMRREHTSAIAVWLRRIRGGIDRLEQGRAIQQDLLTKLLWPEIADADPRYHPMTPDLPAGVVAPHLPPREYARTAPIPLQPAASMLILPDHELRLLSPCLFLRPDTALPPRERRGKQSKHLLDAVYTTPIDLVLIPEHEDQRVRMAREAVSLRHVRWKLRQQERQLAADRQLQEEQARLLAEKREAAGEKLRVADEQSVGAGTNAAAAAPPATPVLDESLQGIDRVLAEIELMTDEDGKPLSRKAKRALKREAMEKQRQQEQREAEELARAREVERKAKENARKAQQRRQALASAAARAERDAKARADAEKQMDADTETNWLDALMKQEQLDEQDIHASLQACVQTIVDETVAQLASKLSEMQWSQATARARQEMALREQQLRQQRAEQREADERARRDAEKERQRIQRRNERVAAALYKELEHDVLQEGSYLLARFTMHEERQRAAAEQKGRDHARQLRAQQQQQQRERQQLIQERQEAEAIRARAAAAAARQQHQQHVPVAAQEHIAGVATVSDSFLPPHLQFQMQMQTPPPVSPMPVPGSQQQQHPPPPLRDPVDVPVPASVSSLLDLMDEQEDQHDVAAAALSAAPSLSPSMSLPTCEDVQHVRAATLMLRDVPTPNKYMLRSLFRGFSLASAADFSPMITFVRQDVCYVQFTSAQIASEALATLQLVFAQQGITLSRPPPPLQSQQLPPSHPPSISSGASSSSLTSPAALSASVIGGGRPTPPPSLAHPSSFAGDGRGFSSASWGMVTPPSATTPVSAAPRPAGFADGMFVTSPAAAGNPALLWGSEDHGVDDDDDASVSISEPDLRFVG